MYFIKSLTTCAVVTIAILGNSLSWAESTAFPEPFGLKWGMSNQELIQAGFNSPRPTGQFEYLTSVTTPKPWSKGDQYLALTYKSNLVKLIVSSNTFTADLYGSEGKALYESVNSIMTKKYGQPSDKLEYVGMKLYDDADEFYQCLDYDGCGAYVTQYQISGGFLAVEIEGQGRGKGFVKITYESPEFYVAKEQIDSANQADDLEAF
ncbi:hypothetical protein DN730_03905 [Marinomonas piezotolerans]|uniref:Uncharacterized protein n=1 Tax=Marinomonas piezotolerans TaxID=2213058 RepID=A0A370UEI4_9GAMM|nr:hypothetical protein [Marinomonas piezotolerans]RDL46190.1 hypothetical protein DN730_03905 [Marinomonas piezotolerans]